MNRFRQAVNDLFAVLAIIMLVMASIVLVLVATDIILNRIDGLLNRTYQLCTPNGRSYLDGKAGWPASPNAIEIDRRSSFDDSHRPRAP